MKKIIYADLDALNDYITNIDGYVYNDGIVEEKNNNGIGGSISVKMIQGKASKGNESITQKNVIYTPAAKLNRVLKYLKDNEQLPYYDSINDETYEKIKRNEYYEFTVKGRLTKFNSFMNLATAIADVYKDINGLATAQSNIEVMNNIKIINNLFENKENITMIFNFRDNICPVIGTINKKFLIHPVEELLSKEVDVFCKVKRKNGSDSIVKLDEIFGSYSDTIEKLSNNTIDYNNPEEIRDDIIGESLEVSIIAIYE